MKHLPLILGAVGATILGWAIFKPSKASASPSQPKQLPGAPAKQLPGGPAKTLPGGIPTPDAENRSLVAAALADLLANGKDPDAMDAVADAVLPYGFVAEAAALHARAAVLRAQHKPQPALPGLPNLPPMPVPVPVPPAVLVPGFAVVTTSDPPPGGDLKILDAPGGTQIGGAHKNGTVAVLQWDAGTVGGSKWAKVSWPGGDDRSSRNLESWPPCIGYVKAQFLKASSTSPVAPPPAVVPVPGQPAGQGRARVTTNDAPPGGDLKILASPGGQQIGGADKNAVVVVLVADAGTDSSGSKWSKIAWPGGSRQDPPSYSPEPVAGYVKAKFLAATTDISGGLSVGNIIKGDGRTVLVASSSGMRLRSKPGAHGETLTLVPANTRVVLRKVAPGPKGDPRSPSPGGWALVDYEGKTGWVQSEWLVG